MNSATKLTTRLTRDATETDHVIIVAEIPGCAPPKAVAVLTTFNETAYDPTETIFEELSIGLYR